MPEANKSSKSQFFMMSKVREERRFDGIEASPLPQFGQESPKQGDPSFKLGELVVQGNEQEEVK